MPQSLTDSALAALSDFVAPLTAAAANDQARETLFSLLGHTEVVSSNPALLQTLQSAAALGDQLMALNGVDLDSWDGLSKVLAVAKQIDTLVQGLREVALQPDLAAVAEKLGEEMAALLLASWLRRRHETVFAVLAFFTLIKLRETLPLQPGVEQSGVLLRTGYSLDEFDFSQVSALISHPAEILLGWYFPNGMAAGADAQLSASRLFPYLARLADAAGLAYDTRRVPVAPPSDDSGGGSDLTDAEIAALVGAPPDDSDSDEDVPADPDDPDADIGDRTDTPVGDVDVDDSLPTGDIPDSYYATYFPTFSLVPYRDATTELRVDLKCSSSVHQGNAAGLLVEFAGDFNQTATLSNWKLTLHAGGEIPALLFGPAGIQLLPGQGVLTAGSAKLVLDYLPESGSAGPAFLFGSQIGTRLELGAVELQMGVTWTGASGVGALVGAGAKSCVLVIAPGDGDGFLSSVLPAKGLQAQFEFGLTWSSGTGFVFNGGAGLDATLPVDLSFGPIKIPTVHLGLSVNTTVLQVELSMSVGLAIGAFQATVDRIGILTGLALPAAGGAPRLGDASVSFKPPSGVGLSLNAAGVSGGGFLAFDTAKHQYTGVLQLQFNDLALQAFGLITTQVAGGSGYSLLALVDANFPPVQLGWGFTLNGVGGLLAVHRSADTDKLRAALKADKLSAVLFPKSAISNAPLVLAQLDALFPTAAGRFLFGPMALIGWGTPTILTIALAIILEEPEPVRIILLARLAALLPSASAPLIKINMDALGVLDLSQSQLALDATLFDSKVMGFTLSGDMALRANWRTQREFLLAIGGFHPQFTPPAGFPALQRVTLDMPSGAISKLRLAAYLAITSNTVQFGANLDVFIGVSGFGLSGHLGFDALLQIDPFHFDADISGSVSLMAGGDDLMSVGLDATLDGPAPWHITGSFKIHFFFFTLHKSFSATWGQSTPALSIPPVQILPLLQTAFADTRNWGISLPANAPALVSLRTQNGTTVVAHPLALLNVHQRLVPLDLDITRFGSAAISGATKFTITDFHIGSASVGKTNVQDDFAPAQFLDLNDTDKLAGPSFERQDAGVSLAAIAAKSSSPVRVKQIAYETFYVDDTGGQTRRDSGQKQALVFSTVFANLGLGASGRAAIWKAGSRRFAAPGKPVNVAAQSFTVASKWTLQSAGIAPAAGTTYSAARTLLANTAQSSTRAQLQIVATHEMAAS